MKHFINYSGILKEFIIYKSSIDYEDIFNNLPNDTADELDALTEYYFDYLFREIQNINVISTRIHSITHIDGLPVIANLYITKNFRQYLSIVPIINKIGINISLPIKDCIMKKSSESLQHIYIMNFDIENEDNFKNYIYNILFYTYIIIHDFKYNPLLKYLNHKNEINDLVKLQLLHLKLFNIVNECSVCFESTITKTICNHVICQKCYCSLNSKICPICRKVLHTDIEDIEFIQFLIN